MTSTDESPLFGLIAEFEEPHQLLHAARSTWTEGYRKVDAFSPSPLDGLPEAIGFRTNRLPLVVFLGGVIGAAVAYFLQWYSAVVDYPFNIGGRPLHSWPSFIPITFELTVLFASLGAVLGMLGLNGLPMPYHPVFNVPEFELASRNRFFLLIESSDPRFEPAATRAFLESMGPKAVREVPR